MLNIERLTRAIQWAVDDHNLPRERQGPKWNQGTWGEGKPDFGQSVEIDHRRYVPVTCATACCIAGNVSLMAGDRFILPDHDLPAPDDEEEVEVNEAVTINGELVNIAGRAIDLLGIDADQADVLFSGGNDVWEVVGYADELAVQATGDVLNLRDADEIRADCIYDSARESMRRYC